MLDCDSLTGQNFNDEFVQNFYDEIDKLRKFNHHIDGLSASVRTPKFRHRSQHKKLPQIDKSMDSDNELNGAINITYHQLYSEMDIPSDLRGMINFDAIKDECDRYHQQVKQSNNYPSTDIDEIVQNTSEQQSSR